MAGLQTQLRMVENYLQRAIDEFDSTPLATQLMRRLANEHPDHFFTAAMKHLGTNSQSPALRLVAVLLLRQDDLVEKLTNPAFGSRDLAIGLFRRFSAVDPAFDVKLARRLPGRSYSNYSTALDSSQSIRALDILDENSMGRRLLPILGHLPDSADTKVSAKATLFVGRRVQNPAWTARQLARPDERIRANAVEALWGLNTSPVVRLLEDCQGDKNNRVVGNSLVGLHIAGQPNIAIELMRMSRQGKADVRSTAAWAMGKLGMPSFLPRLTELVRDDHPQVRGMALRTLVELRRTEVKEEKTRTAKDEAETLAKAQSVIKDANLPVSEGPMCDGTTYSVRRR